MHPQHGPGLPEAEHRPPRCADPEERHPALRQRVSERHPEHITIESDRPIEVGDSQVRLEETIDLHGTGDGAVAFIGYPSTSRLSKFAGYEFRILTA